MKTNNLANNYTILLEDTECYIKVLTLGYVNPKFDGEYFTCEPQGLKIKMNSNYELYNNNKFNNKFSSILMHTLGGDILTCHINEYYKLSMQDNDILPHSKYIRGNKLSTSATLLFKEAAVNKVIDDMVKTFNNRPNKKTNSTKYIPTFIDYKDYKLTYIMRSIINGLLRNKYKLKFTGKSVEKLIKKPKQKPQTNIDQKREEIFYKLFDQGNNGTIDLTNLAMKTLVKSIALTIDITRDKFDTSVIKRMIISNCYNEVLYAKMCGSDDLCEAMNNYKYSPSRYVKIGRHEITKRIFNKYCKNENSDEIFDSLIKSINNICVTRPTYVDKLTKTIAEIFEKSYIEQESNNVN